MYTAIDYTYRDASNYKASGTIYLDGPLAADDIALIASKLNDSSNFIPGDLADIEVAELQSTLTSFPSEDDNVWHELELASIRQEEAILDGTAVISRSAFIEAFRRIDGPNGWDVEGAVIRLDI